MKYLCDPHIIPTLIPEGLSDIESYARECAVYASWLHVDIADGIFTRNTSWPFAPGTLPEEIESFAANVQLPPDMRLEAHLMTAEPGRLGERFAHAGFKHIIGHIEAFADAEEARSALDLWRAAGAEEAGIAIKLDTPVSAIADLIDACDVLHVMSIAEIGYQGKSFDERALTRVEELHATYPDLLVSVDGGVSEATVEALVRAGANRMTVGAALSTSTEPAATYVRIHERAMRGCLPRQTEMAI